MRKCLMIIGVTVWLLTTWVAHAQTAEWLTYTDFAAGYAFEYPAAARLDVVGEAVYVALNQRPPYAGYAIVVLDNSADRSLTEFLALHPDGNSFAPTRVNGLEAAVNGEGTAAWIKIDGAVIKIEVAAGDDGSIEPAPRRRPRKPPSITRFNLYV